MKKFESTDFLESTWASVVSESNVIVVHALVFVAGAGVAAASFWAVGVFSDVLSLEYFSDASFQQLFWKDAPAIEDSSSSEKQLLKEAKQEAAIIDLKESISSRTDESEETPKSSPPPPPKSSLPTKERPALIDRLPSVDRLPSLIDRLPSDVSHQEWIHGHFPLLENGIISWVEFPGLNAAQFVRVTWETNHYIASSCCVAHAEGSQCECQRGV